MVGHAAATLALQYFKALGASFSSILKPASSSIQSLSGSNEGGGGTPYIR